MRPRSRNRRYTGTGSPPWNFSITMYRLVVMDALRLSGGRGHRFPSDTGENSRRAPARQGAQINESHGHAARRIAERPEGDAAPEVGRDGEEEGDAIAARDVEDPSRGPRAHR